MKFLNAFFLFLFLSQCGSITGDKESGLKKPYEGIVTFRHRLIDDNGPLSKKDSILFNTTRTMYLYKNCLIDIRVKFFFEDSNFIRTDTTSYIFFNFDSQSFIGFKRLSKNIEILDKGKIDEKGYFSRLKQYDPLYDIPDSTFLITDTIINGNSVEKIQLDSDPTVKDSEYLKYAEIIKFWVNPNIKEFPIQLSYSLSKKRGNAFVYRREMPLPGGDSYTTITYDYEPKKLPDSLISIFKVLMKK